MTVLSSGSGSAPAPRRHSRASNDDDANRQAVMEVIQLWLDRLQLVSVIVRTITFTPHSIR